MHYNSNQKPVEMSEISQHGRLMGILVIWRTAVSILVDQHELFKILTVLSKVHTDINIS